MHGHQAWPRGPPGKERRAQACALHAGTLNAEQMEGLFSPVPFGEVRTSALERIAAPELAPVWDMFRSIDPDKQAKVLLVGYQP